MSTARDKDLELWKQWQRTKSPVDLQRLLTQMNPIIQREVNRWAAGMSRSLLEAEAKQLAVEAFHSYQPTAGTALSTWVANRLPKLSRKVYGAQNAARLSEPKAMLFHTYNTAFNELRDDFGREPSADELCDRLGWNLKKLESFQQQAGRKEYVESEEHPSSDTADDHLVDLIHHDLTPLQKKIFEYRTGYRGAPKLKGAEICRRLSITQGQLSYQVEQIISFVGKVRGGH